MPTILVIEDDGAILDALSFALSREGFVVTPSGLGSLALSYLHETPIDLVILDVGLPDISGFALCRKIREFSSVPILFLTAYADAFEREMGFELGADDYVTKPFSLKEVVLRVQALLRRTVGQNAQTNEAFSHDETRKRVLFYGQVLPLTRAEYFLLVALMAQPERVFTREQLLNHLPNSDDSGDRVIDTLIKQLRAKLREVNADHDAIITHRGLGYSLSIRSS